jgi:hypothetical protein
VDVEEEEISVVAEAEEEVLRADVAPRAAEAEEVIEVVVVEDASAGKTDPVHVLLHPD